MTLTMREENRVLNLQEYSTGLTSLKSRPRFLVVELTQGCNLSCPMCRPSIITAREKSMSDALFRRITDELFATAEMIDLRGWGESLILPDIVDKIEIAARSGARIRFVTNLAFKRPAVLESLIKHECYIAVSVDTADPELFKVVRGGAKFQLVSDNLTTLVEGYREHHGRTDSIYITTTVQQATTEGLPELVDFAAERGVGEVRLFAVTAEPSSPLLIRSEQTSALDRALEEAAERARRHGVRLIAGTKLGSMRGNPADFPACLHPWAYAYFAYDGGVGFCDHLIGPEGQPFLLGNLNESPFEETWNGDGWQALRREHLTTRSAHAPNFHECAWCYKQRFIDFEHLFDPDAALRRVVLTEPLTLRRLRTTDPV